MQKANTKRHYLRLLVVCLLIFSFISSSLNLSAASGHHVGFSIVKKVKGTSHSDNGFPIDDQEKELESRGEDKCESNLAYVHVLHDAFLFIIAYSNQKYTAHYKPYLGNGTGVPIYIAKRTLLI